MGSYKYLGKFIQIFGILCKSDLIIYLIYIPLAFGLIIFTVQLIQWLFYKRG